METTASILRKYTSATDTEGLHLLAERIPATDTLEDSEPYLTLINAIVGDKTRLDVRFPFDRYQPFDATKIPHDFIITVVEKRPSNFVEVGQRYLPALTGQRLAEIVKTYDAQQSPIELVVSAVSFLEEVSGKPLHTVADLLDTFNSTVLIPIKPIARELGIDVSIEQKLKAANFGGISRKVSELVGKGALRITGKPIPVVELWDKNRSTCAREYIKKLFDLYTSALALTNVTLNITSLYRAGAENGAHNVKKIAGSTEYYNAVDFQVRVKTSNGKNPSTADIEETKQFFLFLLFCWNGGLGIDVSEENLHIHADLRGHMTTPHSGCTAFCESRGTSISSTVSMLGFAQGKLRDEVSVREAYLKAAGGEVPAIISRIRGIKNAAISTNAEGAFSQTDVEAFKAISDTATMLKSVLQVFENVHMRVFRSMFASCYYHHVIDLSDCVESLRIQTRPGSTTYIPLEGSPDPVVQSTGGRTVAVTFTVKTASIEKLTALMSMFVFDELTEMRFGMLFLNHLLEGKRGSGRYRFKYMNAYYRAETIREVLKSYGTFLPTNIRDVESAIPSIGQSSDAVRLNEPVHIQNDILNALGLSTFAPINAQVRTLDEAAGVYTVTVSLQYVNYGMRGLEDLVRAKRGRAPILPLTSRLDLLNIVKKDEKGKNSDIMNAIAIGQVSIGLTLSEFLPLYALYRLDQFMTAAEKILDDPAQGQTIVLSNPEHVAKLFPSRSSVTFEKASYPEFSHFADIETIIRNAHNDVATESIYRALGTVNPDPFTLYVIAMITSQLKEYGSNVVGLNFEALMCYAYLSLLIDTACAFEKGYQELTSFVNAVARQASGASRRLELYPNESQRKAGVLFTRQPLVGVGKETARMVSKFHLHFADGMKETIIKDLGGNAKSLAEDLNAYLKSENLRRGEKPITTAKVALMFQLANAIGIFESFTVGAIGNGSEFYSHVCAHGMRLSLSPIMCSHIAEVLVSLIVGSGIDVIACYLANAQKPLSESFRGAVEREVVQATAAWYVVSRKLDHALLQAKPAFIREGYEYTPEVVSGLYADGKLSGMPGQYFHAVVRVLLSMIVSTLISEDNTPLTLVLDTIDVNVHNIIGAVASVAKVIILVVVAIFAISAIAALLVAYTGMVIIGAIIDVLSAGYGVYLAFTEFIPAILRTTARVILTYTTITAIGVWLKEKLLSGVSHGQFLDWCQKGGIWMPSALEMGIDVTDPYETTYMDYPMVTGPGGVPLSPDFYVYKLGMLRSGYQNLTESIETLASEAENYAKTAGKTPEELMKRFLDEVQDLGASVATELAAFIRSHLSNIHYQGQTAAESGNILTATTIATIGATINSIVPAKYPDVIIRFTGKLNGVTIPQTRQGLRGGGVAISCEIGGTSDDVSVTCVVNYQYARVVANSIATLGKAGDAIKEEIAKQSGGSGRNQQLILGLASEIGTRAIAAINEAVTSHQLADNLASEEGAYTLGRFLLVKSLVGSYFEQVGAPGVSLMRSYTQRVGIETLLHSAAKRYSYILPTIKLYFMEEDSEAFYLFDDFYSYSSIVSLRLTMDRESPQQTCILEVTNVYGKLTNTMADLSQPYSGANPFLTGGSEFSPLNSLMIRPGTKIKVLAGYTPLLTEADTVFIGEVVSVQPGPITTIEARSFGSILLTTLSEQQIKVYGNDSDLLLSKAVRWVIQTVGQLFSSNYLNPVHKLRDIISWILTDLRVVSEYIADYTINPDVSAQIDGELKSATNNIVQVMKETVTPNIARTISEAVGAEVTVTQNNQLFENIRITGDDSLTNLRFLFNMDEGKWISYNDTVWDALNEINLLLPNYILTTRPYATRSTLVWGPEDGYYRFTRKIERGSFLTNQLIEKLAPIVEQDTSARISHISAYCREASKNTVEGIVEGIYALVALVAFYSQQIVRSYYAGRKKPDFLADLLARTQVELGEQAGLAAAHALEWSSFGLGKYDEASKAAQLVHLANAFEVVGTVVENIYKSIPKDYKADSFNTAPVDKVKIVEVGKKSVDSSVLSAFQATRIGGSHDTQVELLTVWALSMEHAAQMVLSRFLDAAYARSLSHRRICETHVKVSGVDIVDNGIILAQAPNVVNLEYPDADTDTDDVAVRSTSVKSTGEIPIHYKLSPRVWNVYTSYFKNANAFPSSRYPIVAAATSSLLAKLAGGMYQGKIVLLGDPRIKENDIIMLWDEANDLYGFVRVKTHTLLISPDEGCLSVITPELIGRRTYMLGASWLDTGFYLIERAINIAMLALTVLELGKFAKKVIPKALVKTLARMGRLEGDAPIGGGVISALTGKTAGKIMSKLGVSEPVVKLTNYFKGNETARSTFQNMVAAVARARKTLEELGSSSAESDIILSKLRGYANAESSDKVAVALSKIVNDVIKAEDMSSIHTKALTKVFGKGSSLSEKVAKYIHPAGQPLNEKQLANAVEDLLTDAYKEAFDDFLKSVPRYTSRDKALKAALNDIGPIENVEAARKELIESIMTHDGVGFSETITKVSEQFTRELTNARLIISNKENVMQVTGKGSAITEAEFIDVIRDVTANVFTPEPFFLRSLASLGLQLFGLYTSKEIFSYVREMFDMMLVNKVLADSVVLSPLFFRGEPFVAGLDGITKKDGEEAGLMDIYTARFQSLTEALKYGVSDPITEALLKVANEQRKLNQSLSMINSE